MNADLIVILGDRFEIFAAAPAAMFLNPNSTYSRW